MRHLRLLKAKQSRAVRGMKRKTKGRLLNTMAYLSMKAGST